MDDETPWLEQNLSRLVRAGMPPDARPGPGARAEVFARLAGINRARATLRSFPDRLVVASAAAIVLIGAWLAGKVAGTGPPAAGFAAASLAVMVVLNLAAVPLAGLVIVLTGRGKSAWPRPTRRSPSRSDTGSTASVNAS